MLFLMQELQPFVPSATERSSSALPRNPDMEPCAVLAAAAKRAQRWLLQRGSWVEERARIEACFDEVHAATEALGAAANGPSLRRLAGTVSLMRHMQEHCILLRC